MIVRDTLWWYKDVEVDIIFPMADTSGRAYTGSAPVSGDVKVVIGTGASPVDTTNLPTHVGSGIWKMRITAAELVSPNLDIMISDQDGPAFEDVYIPIRTDIALSSVTVLPGATTEPNLYGVYISGRGSGTALRLVHDSSNERLTNLFDTLEGTEPSAGAIADNASIKSIWQYIKRRLFGKNTVTSSTHTVFKDDGSTTLMSRTISDDGTTFTAGEWS